MLLNKQKSYGNSYSNAKVNFKVSKRKLLGAIILFMYIAEIILGILWIIEG